MNEPLEIPLDVYVDPWNEEQVVFIHPNAPLLRLRPQASLNSDGIRHLIESLFIYALRRQHEQARG